MIQARKDLHEAFKILRRHVERRNEKPKEFRRVRLPAGKYVIASWLDGHATCVGYATL